MKTKCKFFSVIVLVAGLTMATAASAAHLQQTGRLKFGSNDATYFEIQLLNGNVVGGHHVNMSGRRWQIIGGHLSGRTLIAHLYDRVYDGILADARLENTFYLGNWEVNFTSSRDSNGHYAYPNSSFGYPLSIR